MTGVQTCALPILLDKSDESVTEEVEQMLFGILYKDGEKTTQALDPDIFDRLIEQGLMTAAVAIREQEEDEVDEDEDGKNGVGWQWFGGRLSQKSLKL